MKSLDAVLSLPRVDRIPASDSGGGRSSHASALDATGGFKGVLSVVFLDDEFGHVAVTRSWLLEVEYAFTGIHFLRLIVGCRLI